MILDSRMIYFIFMECIIFDTAIDIYIQIFYTVICK